MPTAYEVFYSPQNRAVTDKLVRYTGYMAFFPIATFYLSYYLLFDGDLDKIMWAGLLAVVAANCVIAAYVRMAWQEDEEESRREREEKGEGGAAEPPLAVKKEM